MDYDEYEKKCKEIEKINAEYLTLFEMYLTQAGLAEKTIKRHCKNVDIYINDFLCHYEPTKMKEGCYKLDWYFDDFFIRKGIGSTPYTMKSAATSIKKFYKCMFENGLVEQKDYEYLSDQIKDDMEFWLENCIDLNDPNIFNDIN